MAMAMVMSKEKADLRKEKALLSCARSFIPGPPIRLPTNKEARLEERLSYFQFNRRNVVQDNHSFFRTFSDQLFGTQADYLLMRRVIATQLRKNPLLYKKHVSGDYNSYCNEVATNRFGDIACAMAACDLFAVLSVELLDAENGFMMEVAPTEMHDDEEQVIYRKVIYSYKSGNEMHSMVPFSDHHLDDPITRMKVQQLEQNLHNPDVILEICNGLLKNQPKTIVPKDEYERLSLRYMLKKKGISEDDLGKKPSEMMFNGDSTKLFCEYLMYNNNSNEEEEEEEGVSKKESQQVVPQHHDDDDVGCSENKTYKKKNNNKNNKKKKNMQATDQTSISSSEDVNEGKSEKEQQDEEK